MNPIIDAHVNIFPQALDPVLEKLSIGPLAHLPSRRLVDKTRRRVRRAGRSWLQPLAESLHRFQPLTRVIPAPVRKALDRLGGLLSLPSFLVESTASDLAEVMSESEIQFAVAIAQPPLTTNEMILREAVRNPKLIPVVNIPPGTRSPGATLKRLVRRGAKALKINPAADDEPLDSPRYASLLEAAETLQIPVILHTGCIHLPLYYKNPELGRVEKFVTWFELYPRVRFLLAHMNYHEPLAALDLAERYPNIYLYTSWQPTEVIGEAVRRIGASRVLFASDWPIGGHNIEVGLRRVKDCVEMGLINAAEGDQVLGLNAAKLFGVSVEITIEQ